VLSDVVKAKQIYDYFSRAAAEKGHAYQRQGRVSALKISEDLKRISARVRGTNNYRVDIELEFGGDGLTDLDGECSCPMMLNCKHVAATMFEALSGNPPVVGAGAGKLALVPSPPPPLSYEIAEWIAGFDKVLRGDEFSAEVSQRVLYCFRPFGDEGRTPVLAVSLRSARLNKSGEFAANYSQPSLHDFVAERAPNYLRNTDVEIMSHLSAIARASFHEKPKPAALLQQIVATGRAFWLDHRRTPLRWADSRQGRIEWLQFGKRGVIPQLIVTGTIALNAEPPVYIDEAAGTIGEVELDLPPRLSRQILSAPPIPRAQVEEASRRLGRALPEVHHGLLPASPTPAVRIDQDPIPVLRLRRGDEQKSSYYYYGRKPEYDIPIGVAQLGFRYGPLEIDSASGRDDLVEAFHAGQVYSVTRRRTREKAARKILTQFDFVEARQVFPYLDQKHVRDLTMKEPRNWLDFLVVDAAELRAQGFEIHVDDNFPYRLAASSGEFDAEFESSGIDWFELALGVELDGERRDLAPMLAALLAAPDFDAGRIRKLADEGENVYLQLADGRYLSLAADRFLPLVLALHGLRLSGAFAEASGKIKLSRADIVPLLALENEKFVFRGADSLRQLADLVRVRGLSHVPLPKSFRAQLRPYQAQGVAWLDLLRESGLGGVLADDMGLGKTVQILALLALEKARGHLSEPALIVAPTSLMSNWFSEARKFAPDLRVLVLHGPGRKQCFASISDHDVVLTTYPLIARDREVLLSRDWHMAVLDEAQTVKNPDASTTRWLREVKAKHRFCMTGTPMENHLGELWSIMSFANPGYLGDKASFTRQWRTPIEKRADTARATVLAQRVKPFLLRRTKAEVAAELPAKSEIVERIVIEGGQRDLYDSIRLSMSEKVRKAIAQRGLAKSHIVVLEALLRMRQACCDPALLKLDDGIERPSAKLDRLMDMVLELLSEGRKIIVFSQFTSMLDLIRTRFDVERVRYSLLTGKTKDRKEAIDGFQNGASDVFLVSLKAGGVGLNLTAADTVIIFDPWWNPAVEEQAIDRTHRIGQDKAVFVYRLVASGTIEEKMDELKARKRALADSLFDREGRIASTLTEEDVRALFDA
jgi:superfamily II DNA or RNA helicase